MAIRLSLAPLAGFTDAPFRRLCHEGGADLTYTEMVSAAGLAHGSSPTRQLYEVMPGEGAVACQLFGARETDVAAASREVAMGATAGRFVELNLNAGCPMTKVTRCGAGAALVRSPERVYRLVKAMVENSELMVSLKTRLGPHPGETTVHELIDAAAAAGAKKVIVHARYVSQLHGGPLYLDKLAEAVKRSPIPIAGNGSITDMRSLKAMAATGVQEVMIGRAALAEPAIFSRLKGEAVGGDQQAVFERHLGYLIEFRRQLVRRFPNDHIPTEDGFLSVKMHTHLFRYFNGRPGAAKLRAQLNSVRTLAAIRAALAALSLSGYEGAPCG